MSQRFAEKQPYDRITPHLNIGTSGMGVKLKLFLEFHNNAILYFFHIYFIFILQCFKSFHVKIRKNNSHLIVGSILHRKIELT